MTRQHGPKTPATPVVSWKNAGSRSEKGELIREALLNAAAEVVGEVGYASASVTLITQRAGVAQGTFYNYFETRQDILDKVLPNVGKHMLEHVRVRAHGEDFATLEESSFRAFFSYLDEMPHFFRILNEAENFAPAGHREHFQMVVDGYMHFLRRSFEAGELPMYTEDELETVAYILISARAYLTQREAALHGKPGIIADSVVNTYMKILRFGLTGGATPSAPRPTSQPKQNGAKAPSRRRSAKRSAT